MVYQVADEGLYYCTREFARLLCSVKRSTVGRVVSRCQVENGAGVSTLQGHGTGGFFGYVASRVNSCTMQGGKKDSNVWRLFGSNW